MNQRDLVVVMIGVVVLPVIMAGWLFVEYGLWIVTECFEKWQNQLK